MLYNFFRVFDGTGWFFILYDILDDFCMLEFFYYVGKCYELVCKDE